MSIRALGPLALCSAMTIGGPGGCKRETTPPPVAPGAPEVTRAPAASPTGESIYDTVAPATVLVSTPWGLGSGVFVGETGRVLTNYHVVASGHTEDYGIEATITTVRVRDDGSV
jgi:S1-C subfamily serine protease